MSSSGQHKEGQWPLSPLSAPYSVSPATPHYRTPQSQDGLFPVYDPHEQYKSRQEWPMQNGNGHANGVKPSNYGGFAYGTPVGAATRRPKPWWMLGYEKWTGLGMFIFFGGAILGFSLSRTPMLSFNELLKLTTPGEGYWYSKSPGKANIIIHIFTSLPASFFSVFCFLPITYNRWPRFHSVLGYIVSILLLVSLVCGAIVGRRAQGGDLNVQAGVYMLASGSAYAVVMGILEARRGALNEHREWMLRAWFYNGAFVTTRVTALLSAQVITAINSYFSLWQCAEVGYVLLTQEALAREYPLCVTSEALSNPAGVHVAVHSSWNEGKLGRASASRASFGMALWVAMLLHGLGIEFYLRATARESKQQLKELSDRRTAGHNSELPHRSPRYEGRLQVESPLLNYSNSTR